MIKHVELKMELGSAPLFLGVDGLAALMHDKLVRFQGTRNYDEIVGLAGDALMLLYAAALTQGVEDQTPQKVDPEPSSASSREPVSPCPICGLTDVPKHPATQDWPQEICSACYNSNSPEDLIATFSDSALDNE